jgi:hypothetical protein
VRKMIENISYARLLTLIIVVVSPSCKINAERKRVSH